MKHVLPALLILSSFFNTNTVAGQKHKLVKVWESDTLLKVPESVLFDKTNSVLYASNIDGQPWDRDGKGSIGKLDLNGKIIAAEWITGLHAPKGLGMYKGNLFVADLDEVVVIDKSKGEVTKRIKVEGAQGLNDISVSKNGDLYVSDSKTLKVYVVKNGVATVYLETLEGPNGVLVHNDAVYVLDKGALYKANGDKSLQKLAEGMEGGTDGVEHIQNGDFIVSCWGGAIWYVSGDGNKELLLDTRKQKINAADIGYDAARRIIYVPTFWKNSVVAYQLQ